MVQQERAQLTRDRLVDGAALAFYRLGYGIATTNDIIKEAGTTRGAMYFHFQSKEEIARAVIDKEHQLASDAGIRIQAMKRPAFETMILLCIDLAERLMKDPVVKAGIRLTTEITNFDPPLRAPYEDWLRTFAGITVEAIAEGDFRDDVDPEVFARFLIPAYTGIQLVSDTFTGRADLLQRIREMWTFVLPAVVPTSRLEQSVALLESLIPRSDQHQATARL
jgi:AcrR family transcriptional regulator